MEKRPDWYMFGQHSKETVAAWARDLRYFHFVRAWGGHANDGDAFKAGILFKDRIDLENKLAQLGIVPGVIGPGDPQPITGKSYPYSEFQKFKTPVAAYPDLEQPSHVSIAAQNVFVTIRNSAILFSVSGTSDGNLYEVSESDFQTCIKIEKVFEQFNWQQWKDTSLAQSSSCVSRLSYPEFY